ncbi:hypothetical protein [Cyanobium sp. ATX 6F1]|uniref:hypothetical protein n=1 Tax=unclassified Cyanobium TaxID=2627006 RepID=UPI0020CBDF80|nr:hypothetical protein [Cyanobium sp. ATX 6F1]MCP9916388.1 hypothetical protein [Cyanobium sp. ATX 6F1]
MSAPQSLLQAAVNRLSARLQSGVAEALSALTSLAELAPERLQQEWSLFVEEVEQEAERLERGETAPSDATPGAAAPPADIGVQGQSSGASPNPQDQIDALRAQVAGLASRLEDQP